MALDGLSFVISECRRYEKMYVRERSNYWLSHHLVTHNYYYRKQLIALKTHQQLRLVLDFTLTFVLKPLKPIFIAAPLLLLGNLDSNLQ